jgi:WD40 repeat protein
MAVAERLDTTLSRAPVTYDAFISYSHAKDKPIATALQSLVQKLGKAWYRRRALRLFRDDTSLSATPHLWSSIEQALGQSRFLILLASPEAAASRWVGQEIAYWLDHNSADTVLIALTAGELDWDEANGDFRWSEATPLPRALKNRFAAEPRWIDLGRYRDSSTPKGAEFMELASNFAARIQGIPKEDLLSQEVRQQRKALTLAWSAAALLLVLASTAVGFAVFGFDRAREAGEGAQQCRDAACRSTTHQSRFLADMARQRNESGDQATALALALEALPDRSRGVKRPYFADAEKELFAAQSNLRQNAELRGHESRVNSVAFSRDGKRFVTASDDKLALIWNAAGEKITSLEGHKDTVRSASFSPDGKLVVTASEDRTARIWDTSSGREILALIGHDAQVNSAVFSTDGKRVVTASGDGTARVWDLATRKTIQTLHHSNDAASLEASVMSAAFSLDGSHIVTAGADEKAYIWDLSSGRKIAGLADHQGPVLCAAFSADGKKIVTSSSDRKVRLFDVAAATGPIYPYLIIIGHDDAVGAAEFFPDGKRIATASKDGTARVWDAGSGALLFVLRAGSSPVRSVAVSPDGTRIVTASIDNAVRIWDATEDLTTRILTGHEGNLNTAAFSPDSSLIVTSSDDSTARVWDAMTGATRFVLRTDAGRVLSAEFSPDGTAVLTVSDDNTAIRWDAFTGEKVFTLGDHETSVLSAVFSPDGKQILTTSQDNNARLRDSRTGALIAMFSGNTGTVTFSRFSPNGQRIVTVSYDQARIWDRDTGTLVRALSDEHHIPITSAIFSPDSDGARVLTTKKDNTAALWDTATGGLRTVLHGHDHAINTAVFCPDGHLIATASDDGTARIWDSESGNQVFALRHEDQVKSATFSADGKRILTASWDKTARIWSTDTGALLAVLRGHEEAVGPLNGFEAGAKGLMSAAVMSADGTQIVTTYVGGWIARVWTVFPSTQALVNSARSRMPVSLTADQRRQFFLQ